MKRFSFKYGPGDEVEGGSGKILLIVQCIVGVEERYYLVWDGETYKHQKLLAHVVEMFTTPHKIQTKRRKRA